MSFPSRAASRLLLTVPLAGLLLTTGCGSLLNGGGRIANDPRYVAAFRTYYNAHAREREPGCDQPQVVLMEEQRVIDSFPQLNTLQMWARYRYEQRQPSGELVCQGIASRYFTVRKAAEHPTVAGMDGPERAGS